MTNIIGFQDGGQVFFRAGNLLSLNGWNWDASSYRDFNSDGDYYNGFTKTGQSEIIIGRVRGGSVGFFKGAVSNWANRTTLTYSSLESLSL